MCNNTHYLNLSRPLKFYCAKQRSTSRTYNHWNRPSIEFCMNCLMHRCGRNLGYCWFCTTCEFHRLNYVNGMSIILYNETHTIKHGGAFTRCSKCSKLRLSYNNDFKCPCNNQDVPFYS